MRGLNIAVQDHTGCCGRGEQTRNKTEKPPVRYTFFLFSTYAPFMRCAFVVRLGSKSKPSEGRIEGCVEEVDSGRQLKFGTAHELVKFLGDRFEEIQALQANNQAGENEQNSDGC